jgi:hypothetical protein
MIIMDAFMIYSSIQFPAFQFLVLYSFCFRVLHGPAGWISTLGNWAGMTLINYGRVMLGPSGGHVGQHGMAHSVIRVMPGLSLKHEHGPIGPRIRSVRPKL